MEPELLITNNDALMISVAVPLDASRYTVRLLGGNLLFHVAIMNVSDTPQKIWAEDCSAGNGALTLEITAIGEKELSPPIIVERHAAFWRRNIIRGVTLEPGDAAVRAVRLFKYRPEQRLTKLSPVLGNQVDYTGFPSLNLQSASHTIRMRALFKHSAGDWAERQGIWTGHVASPMRDYTIWGDYT